MREAAEFLNNLVLGKEYLKATIKEGVAALKPYAKDLEAVHIRIDHPDLSTWRKKKYFHILRQVVCSRLDEWIFEHLVNQNEYAAFLKRYRPMRARGEIGDIDEYIMDTHYRPQAIEILRRKKSFDLGRWTKNAFVWNTFGVPIYIGRTGQSLCLIIAMLFKAYLFGRIMAIERLLALAVLGVPDSAR